MFFKQKDLLLLAKTSFRKNLIFQLLLFFIAILEIVLIFIMLKLYQAKQNKLINRFLEERTIVFNNENSSNSMFIKISKGEYIYVFISLEIAIFKRFKKYIFD